MAVKGFKIEQKSCIVGAKKFHFYNPRGHFLLQYIPCSFRGADKK